MKIVFASTFNTVGECHSDLPIVGLQGEAIQRLDSILLKLRGQRTRFERSGQKRPSLFWAMDMEGEELETWMPRKIIGAANAEPETPAVETATCPHCGNIIQYSVCIGCGVGV